MVQDGGVVTVSLDANFGLVRKHNAGSSFVDTKYDDSYFLDGSEVDTFISNYDDGKRTEKVIPYEQIVCQRNDRQSTENTINRCEAYDKLNAKNLHIHQSKSLLIGLYTYN